MPTTSPSRLTLRQLPLAARLTLALFLISTGVGYLSALVQLHFQHATPGAALPTPDDAVRIFHGSVGKPMSQIERLLRADESASWNGSGQMSAAFTRKSADWKESIQTHAKALYPKAAKPTETELSYAETSLRRERDGERLALLAWIDDGAVESAYNADAYPLPADWGDQPITPEYRSTDDAKTIKIKSILNDRCVRCHTSKDSEDAKASEYPFETFAQLKPRVTVAGSSAMSLTKLAQTTHVHLLGFSMLYGLTGLILAFSSYPGWLRVLLCPLPLLAQVFDISFWWLARLPEQYYGPEFARLIAISGAVVAVGLLLHLVLSLFDLFGRGGKLILLLLFVAVGFGAGTLVGGGQLQDYLQQEKSGK